MAGLFIRMKVNDCPLIGFVSGCATSFVSESFAKKANLNIDRSKSGDEVYLGGVLGGMAGTLIGRVDNVPVLMEEIDVRFSYQFGVMPDKFLVGFCSKKFDMLIGLDLMLGLPANIVFGEGLGLEVRGKLATFLTEAEIEQMEDTAASDK